MSASAPTDSPSSMPICMGLAELYGSTAAGAARGLALRTDHGAQYLSDQMAPTRSSSGASRLRTRWSPERQWVGVAERFNRTLKRTGDPWSHLAATSRSLRDAVRDFVEIFYARWLAEKNWLPDLPLKLVRRGKPRFKIRLAA